MHVGKAITDIVAFIGTKDPSAPGGIQCSGTGFLLGYKGTGYLVTARHVAEPLQQDPFVIRVNRYGEQDADLIAADAVKWSYHPDPLVDLAVVPLHMPPSSGTRALYFPDSNLATSDQIAAEGINVGDLCYTIGLFHFLSGHSRNLPMVYSGGVALMPPKGETIPVGNEKGGIDNVEGYLVESQAIKGASGSPVFVRSTVTMTDIPLEDGRKAGLLVVDHRMFLLGVFQSAWFLPPDAPLRHATRATVTDVVPVGLGVVVPADKLVELLEMPDLQQKRKDRRGHSVARQTVLTSSASSVDSAAAAAPLASGENPKHREDFTSLLNAAAKTPPQDD